MNNPDASPIAQGGPQVATAQSAGPLELELEHGPVVSFALQQAAVPSLHRLRIHWTGPEPLRDGVVRIRPEPAFADSKVIHLAEIASGAEVLLADRDLDLALNPTFLSEQRERVKGRLVVEVATPERVLLERSFPLSVLAFNEWSGLLSLPELLAAFVTPNLPSIARLMATMSKHLAASTGDPSLDAYQRNDTSRVLRMVEAAYLAVREQEIVYANPPASYEVSGQKIRFADEVVLGRLGTCLDLTLLLCGLLEQAGLRPVILLESDHAYVGCWLRADGFAEAATDDLQSVRKRFDEGSLTVIESTLAVSGGHANFGGAEAEAKKRLFNRHAFRLAIDVARARASRIHPLPIKVEEGRIAIAPRSESHSALAPVAGAVIERRPSPVEDKDPQRTTPANRVQYWANQLLDLSLRNRLLNFGRGKCVQAQSHALGVLEDKLAANEEFQLLPQVIDDPRSARLHDARHSEDLETERLEKDLQARKLRLVCPPDKIDSVLTGLARDARLALEEGGANTLYLALGVLEWRERGKEDVLRRAPLLLMPVTLTRKSVHSGFRLRRIEEETRTNVTLLEKLQRDFEVMVPEVNPPPEDDSGVDVGLVLQRFRAAVRDVPGFEVKEEAWLGLFQFTKFLLWKDLSERTEQLKRNPVVRHLIETPRDAFASSGSVVEAHRLDDELPPAGNFCILDSDSSQLSAVLSAARGLSFVMIGPPGTGKSQTIANIIAFLIATGKTVLFVAEKRAALEVVQKRLNGAGLGPFCLELHSNKTGKTEVYDQFRKAVEYACDKEPEEWARETQELQVQRARLNAVVAALHRRLQNGYSAYRCHGLLLGEAQERPRLVFGDIATHTPERVTRMREKVREFTTRLRDFPEPARHPLAPVRHREWSPAWEEQLLSSMNDLTARSEELRQRLGKLTATLGRVPPPTRQSIDSLVEFLRHLLKTPAVPSAFLQGRPSDVSAVAQQALTAVSARRQSTSDLAGWDIEKVLSMDVPSFRRQWDDALKSFFLVRPFRKKKVLKAMALLRSDRVVPTADVVAPFFESAEKHQRCEKAWKEADQLAGPLLGSVWNRGDPATGLIEDAVRWQSTFVERLKTLARADVGLLGELRRVVTALVEADVDLTSTSSPFRRDIEALDIAAKSFVDAWDRTTWALAADASQWRDLEIPEAAVKLCKQVRESSHQLQAWCHLGALRHALVDFGLGPLAELTGTRTNNDDLPELFELAYADASLRQLLQEDPLLREFFGDTHTERIEAFRTLDERLLGMAAKVVSATVAAKRPQTRIRGEKPVDFGEIGILNHELTRRARHKPIRQLLQGIPNILPRLKPCLLMSPLSVAQYLSPEHPPFDVVVFDEASQIPVSDAVGAIARGTQVIVSGDPRQLPPTNFFQRTNTDDAEDGFDKGEEVPSDAESILDECINAQLPLVHLRWHYRSRHESLIAFSNHHYYEDNLLTHPEPFAEERGVRWTHVPGVYDRAGTATNRAEAEAVVGTVTRHYKDPGLATTSIGVVTFSVAQQKLIEDLLDQARANDLELDNLLSAERDEALFVKNLENVQGDERDVIVFSITYGPDASGAVYHNFGPLNQVGGERRLNVAVTRARKQIQVFSTLRPEQIDLSRTRATGARHLKSYLEYAARGPSVLPARAVDTRTETSESNFEKKVAAALRSKGWTVHSQVGCSSYRVDLAVVHPEHPGRYVIGIECDGRTYHSAATARDRDRLRPRILENLGWRVCRVWSSDWFRDPERERQRLFAVVAEAIAKFTLDVPAPPPPEIAASPKPDSSPVPTRLSSLVSAQAADTPMTSFGGQPYRFSTIKPGSLSGLDPYNVAHAPSLRNAIASIVEAEGPISQSLLASRMAAALGMERTTAKLQDRIAELIPTGVLKTKTGSTPFFLTTRSTADAYTDFRPHAPGSAERRPLADICAHEQANAMLHLVRTYFQVPTEDLLRQTCILFGYGSLTAAAREALRPGLNILGARTDVIQQDGAWKPR